MNRRLWGVACGLAAAAVLLGAFGAHGLQSVTDDVVRIRAWRTGALYHLVHAIALLGAALHPDRPVWGPRLLGAGIAVFSGSLYALALTDVRALGAITPVGGVLFVAGWIARARGR